MERMILEIAIFTILTLIFTRIIIHIVKIYRLMISEINKKNKKLEELTKAAQQASMAKSAFLANISHEIRTTLNAIIGITLIAKKNPCEKKDIEAINKIESASKHLLGILNNVLDMSKIESGKFELVNEVFPLMTAINEVTETMQHRCDEKNITLKTNFKEINNYCVLGDRLRLKQVLFNLLGNARKFTNENGLIIFTLKKIKECEKGVKIQFTIKDDGIGMTENQINKLFMPFSQANSGVYNRFGGTGLGLSISQNLVKMMGSEIHAKSKPNEGSSFEFTIGFKKAKKRQISLEDTLETVPDLSGKRILLVEDIEINRMILMELLEDTHVEFGIATNGEEAVSEFFDSPEHHYDLIFMDIQMPLVDGYEATRRIRQLKRDDAHSVPIVAMTANAYREDIEMAFASGMNGHLSKPIDVNAMMKMLSEKMLCSSSVISGCE